MVASVHGIDFSGNEKMWRPGCRRSNVWIATAELRADLLKLVALRRVQVLPGTSHPFDRLVAFLAGDNYLAAAIDAPFALPSRHMPVGGFPVLLRDVARFETGRRPFAKGEMLREYGKSIASLKKPKPLRKTEQIWSDRGCSVRSTLWNKARPGAPFSTASPARAPQLFAGLHEATSLPWPPWRFKIRSGTACGAIFPDFTMCSTQPRRKVSEASGRWPIASVKHSTCAMGADGASARAAARHWPTSRPRAKSRCLRHGGAQARCAGPGCSPDRWRRHTMCLARSARCASLRWCASRPTRSAWSGTP